MATLCDWCQVGDHTACDWPCDCAHRCEGCSQAPIVCECDALADLRMEEE